MLCNVSAVNTTYLFNHTLRKPGIQAYAPKFRVGCCVGCHVGCLVGLDDRTTEENEGQGRGWAMEIKHNT
jgi:hypothetical protein